MTVLRVLDGKGVVSAAHSDADLAMVDANDVGSRHLAALLRAAGVPVWWIDPSGQLCPGLAAPAFTSTGVDDVALDTAAEMARRPGAGRDVRIPASVVVTTLNEGPALDRLIEEITAQMRSDDELIVVDGGSSDGSVERTREAWCTDTRVRIEVVIAAGISEGRNCAVRLARHDLIVCTDVGCTPEAGWLSAMRAAFGGSNPPGLASGLFRPTGDGPLDRAQALACYPDPYEVRRHDLSVQAWTKLFGTGFDARFSIGRNMAFTRQAWSDAGGFPEHLATGEDVSFGLAVARYHRCVGVAGAVVGWEQRKGLLATWAMFRSYGRASTDGGDPRLLVRDGLRGAAYLTGLGLAASGPRGRVMAAAGGITYLILPTRRAVRAHAPVAAYPLLPVALATKDLGKLAGAVQGFHRARRRERQWSQVGAQATQGALSETPLPVAK